MRSTRADERGAVAVMVAGLLVVIVAVAAIAVDLGMQRVVRSDMQAVADVVALDSARLLDGRTAKDVRDGSDGQPALQAAAEASAGRNQSALGAVSTVTAVLVFLDQSPVGAVVPRRTNGILVPVPDTSTPDAVLVSATGQVAFRFAPGSGAATRTALGTASSYGCFRLGSFAASLKSDSGLSAVFESLIGDALGINLQAIGYEGLLSSSIGIAALAAELGVGTPQALINLDNVKVATLFSASARVLSSQGDTAASAIFADIATKVSQTVVLDIGDVLAVGNGAGLAGNINAVDLLGSSGVAASTVLANSNNFLDTGVAWSAPHVSNGDITLKAIAAPAQYCGPIGGGTSTAQVTFNSSFGFTLPNKVNPNNMGDLLIGNIIDFGHDSTMTIDASLAGATGKLSGLTCGAGTTASPQVTKVNVDTNLLTAKVTLPFRVKGSLSVGTGSVVSSALLTSLFSGLQTATSVVVTLDLKGTAASMLEQPATTAATPTIYSVPPLVYGQAQPSAGAGNPMALPTPSVTLDTSGSATISVTGSFLGLNLSLTTKTEVASVPVSSLNLNAVISALTSTVIGSSTSTVVTNVNEALTPVAKLLGIRAPGADVIGSFPPSCGAPALVG